MTDITDPKVIYTKGFLFLFCGLTAAVLLIMENPNVRTIVLLILSILCFARFYYFAFYVITNYVDSSYRFSGLLSFAVYLFRKMAHKHRD